MKVTVDAIWRDVGEVPLYMGGLIFPSVPDDPGVYRFRFVRPDGSATAYVGEATRLRRRFGNYRLGPVGQTTSRRVHLRMREHLRAGGQILVLMISEATVMVDNGSAMPLNLARKRSRLLVENAALHALPSAEPIENRPGVGEAD